MRSVVCAGIASGSVGAMVGEGDTREKYRSKPISFVVCVEANPKIP
jgi:hypothetical protein